MYDSHLAECPAVTAESFHFHTCLLVLFLSGELQRKLIKTLVNLLSWVRALYSTQTSKWKICSNPWLPCLLNWPCLFSCHVILRRDKFIVHLRNNTKVYGNVFSDTNFHPGSFYINIYIFPSFKNFVMWYKILPSASNLPFKIQGERKKKVL